MRRVADRGGLRLAVLLAGSIGSFVVVNLVSGLPFTVGPIAWSVWYSIRSLGRGDELDG
ncbi:MAG: hypothetical protein ACRDLK_10815 [Gaiellaceae bacterium]